ncbi:NADPH:quinone reductase [Actinobacteria bacterium YIM 96077]|uniref:NADPH:quinone reductase n=1 Tax=Phytoactinopolyspora halophila TaxID=1981511 RepID=A0A329R1W3_9ACTN|nr:zinc-binding dehydrogenase [Phytoactinopolyspora halophila]AYY12207.1 NADPH:quinone reductase [Actinobacteria bacterium YIM 96077]RAW18560.1 NADPH:quinone reductase [Phytoactinopolyspora halophila]
MRTVHVSQFGGPEVLVPAEAPDPVAGSGEVVIDVSVADILFLDTQLRSGWGQEFFGQVPPYVPGGGVAGEVASVGAGVDPEWVGRRVVASVDGGGYADSVVAAADRLVPVPDGLSDRDAAALLQIGPAALRLVDDSRVGPGQWVLVSAVGGGLGSLLLQLARAAGARVVGAGRGESKLALARQLGAEAVVDYSEPGWEHQLRQVTGGRGVDVVFDGVGGTIGQAAFGVVAPGGRFYAYGVPSGGFAEIDPEEAERRDVTVRGIELVQFTIDETRRLVEAALAEAHAGRIAPVIGQTFPLDQVAEAHAAIESRTAIGKTLLLV